MNSKTRYQVTLIYLLLVSVLFSGCTGDGNNTQSTLGAIRGKIIGDDLQKTGPPAAGVSGVKVYCEEYPDRYCLTDGEGEFLVNRIPQGTVHLIAEKKTGEKIYRARSETIFVLPAVTAVLSAPLIITEAKYSLAGRVVNQNNKPLFGVTVTVWGQETKTGIDGNYLLTGLLPGIWNFVYSKDNYETYSVDIEIGPELTTEFNVQLEAEDGVSSGTVTSGLPDAPGGLRVSNINPNGFTLRWNEVKDAIAYKIYLDDILYYTLFPAATSYTITELKASTTYSVKVSAVNNTGEGNPSSALAVTTESLD